ncbi:MAG: protease modulator HflC [Sedimentisphaerales bacterium]|nr:protease modulator HflC [Sedimentisphaerales bacterium]
MRNVSILILVSVIAIVLILFLFSFQVRETEVAVVLRFDEPVRTIPEPGWKFKWPQPIESVRKYDSRGRLYERKMEETTTRGGEPIIVTSYVVWSVEDPIKFLRSVGDINAASPHLYSLLGNTQNTVVGKHYFTDFVNTNPAKVQFQQIEKEMLDMIQPVARNSYGIEIKAVGIKQLAISESVTQKVFERMKADRKRKTETILAQGQAEATKIKTSAEAKRTELLAMVEAQAQAIRGEGDAEAAKYYKQLERDPELAMFLRDLEALKKILKKKSTVILGTDVDPIGLLKTMPDLKNPGSANK